MSTLHFLPRLVSWSNLYKTKIPSDQELVAMTSKLEQSREKERPIRLRRKISYWSDDELNNHFQSRSMYPAANVNKNLEPEFVTKWRPQTTFGYANDFDIRKHQKISLHKFEFKSKPKILRRLN